MFASGRGGRGGEWEGVRPPSVTPLSLRLPDGGPLALACAIATRCGDCGRLVCFFGAHQV